MVPDYSLLGSDDPAILTSSPEAFEGAIMAARKIVLRAMDRDATRGMSARTIEAYGKILRSTLSRLDVAEARLGRLPTVAEAFSGLSHSTARQYLIKCRRIVAASAWERISTAEIVDDVANEGPAIIQNLASVITLLTYFLAPKGKALDGLAAPIKGVHSKSAVVRQLARSHPEWESQVYGHVHPTWRTQVAVLALSGARPEELRKGIRVKLAQTPDGQVGLRFELAGAKVIRDNPGHSNSGHESRTVVVSRARLPKIWDALVVELDRQGGESILVGYPQKAISNEALTMAIKRAGRLALGQAGEQLSAYCFRHSLAFDCKSSGYGRLDLAKALGHLTDLTQGLYGSKRRSAKGRSRWGNFLLAAAASSEQDIAMRAEARIQAFLNSQQPNPGRQNPRPAGSCG